MLAMSAKPPDIYVLQISFFYTTIPFGYVKGPFLFFMRCICENLRCPVILIQSRFDTNRNQFITHVKLIQCKLRALQYK